MYKRTRIIIVLVIAIIIAVIALVFAPKNHPTAIDYSRTPSQHILAANFVNVDVCTEDTTNNTIISGVRDTVKMRLFTFSNVMTVSEAGWEMRKYGYEPANVIGLVSFVTQHPEYCRNKRVVALSPWRHHNCYYPMVVYEDQKLWTVEIPESVDLRAYYLAFKSDI